MQVRVVRQTKGVDSNKLQPIIRHHNDKDFRVPSTSDIKPLDHNAIYNFKNGLKRRDPVKLESSVDLGESSEALENRTEEESTSSHLFNRNPSSSVQGKRGSKSNNETFKGQPGNFAQLKNSGKKSAKELPKNMPD